MAGSQKGEGGRRGMLMVLRPFLALLALVALGLFFSAKGVKSALAPLCAVCAGGLWLCFFGMAGFLRLGGWLLYGLAALAAGWLLWRGLAKKQPLPRLGYGFWLFAAGGLLLLLVLLARQPMFLTWDEFSFWGTAGKLLKLNDALYTTAEIGWAWPVTQLPLLSCLSYLVQFFGPGFSEWQHYFGVDLLMLASLAALLAPLEKKDGKLALPLALIGFLTPFLLTLYSLPVKVAPPWLDSLADVPMGFLLGGALAAWLAGEGRGWRRMLPPLLALAALTFTKETCVALALVAAGLMALDALAESRPEGQSRKRHIARAGLVLAGGLATVLGSYLLWARYLAATLAVNRLESGGVSNLSPLGMVTRFFSELFSPEKSEHFRLITGGMPRLFLESRGSMLGSGAMITLAILLLIAAAALLAKQAAQRRRCVVFGVFSALGFLPYFFFITLSYLYVFRTEQAFESFERYLYPYYIGWFLAAVLLLAQAAKEGRSPALGKALVLGLSLLLGLRVFLTVPPVMSVVAFHPAEYAARRQFQARVEALTAQLSPEGKTFIISENDPGMQWFVYCYAFLPWQVDYSFGGGAFETRELQPDGSTLKTPVDAAGWGEYLRKNGVTTVFIDEASPAFAEAYGSLFTDGMQGYFDEETVIYEVVPQGGSVRLESAGILV